LVICLRKGSMSSKPALDPACCPADPGDACERYLLRRMSEEETRAFEDHVIGCPICAGLAMRELEIFEALRRASPFGRT